MPFALVLRSTCPLEGERSRARWNLLTGVLLSVPFPRRAVLRISGDESSLSLAESLSPTTELGACGAALEELALSTVVTSSSVALVPGVSGPFSHATSICEASEASECGIGSRVASLSADGDCGTLVFISTESSPGSIVGERVSLSSAKDENGGVVLDEIFDDESSTTAVSCEAGTPELMSACAIAVGEDDRESEISTKGSASWSGSDSSDDTSVSSSSCGGGIRSGIGGAPCEEGGMGEPVLTPAIIFPAGVSAS